MANDAAGVSWDAAAPADADLVSVGAQEVRGLRAGTGLRVAKEHDAPAAGSVGGEHKAGSAKVYTGAAPTLRPDGTTALSAADNGRLYFDGSVLKVYVHPSWVTVSGAGSTNVPIANLYHTVAAGTHAGTFANGTWVDRPLNTEIDPNGIVTLAANAFTLAAGTYHIRARAPAFRINGHQIRLQNTTDGTTTAVGSSAHSGSSGDYGQTDSVIDFVFTIAGAKTYKIQHRCETNGALGSSFGRAANLTVNEVYCQVQITKMS